MRSVIPHNTCSKQHYWDILTEAQMLRGGWDRPAPVSRWERDALFYVLNVKGMSEIVAPVARSTDKMIRALSLMHQIPVITNHPGRTTNALLHLDPTGPAFARAFEAGGGVDMFYLDCPMPLLDVIMLQLLDVCNKVLCVRVPVAYWTACCGTSSECYFRMYRKTSTLLRIHCTDREGESLPHHWMLIFKDHKTRLECCFPGLSPWTEAVGLKDGGPSAPGTMTLDW
jgi:hypothetical protein